MFAIALKLYRKRKLSLGKAAELSRCSLIEFVERLKQEREYIFDFNEEEIDEIFEDIEKEK